MQSLPSRAITSWFAMLAFLGCLMWWNKDDIFPDFFCKMKYDKSSLSSRDIIVWGSLWRKLTIAWLPESSLIQSKYFKSCGFTQFSTEWSKPKGNDDFFSSYRKVREIEGSKNGNSTVLRNRYYTSFKFCKMRTLSVL